VSRGGRSLRILAFEGSGAAAGVALLDQARIAGESAVDTRRARTELLLELARRLLEDTGLAVSDLDRLAYSEGPGSFTGLRIGLAAVLGLSIGAGTPVVPVPSLEVIAYPWRGLGLPILPLTGHRRGQVYNAALRWDGRRFETLAPGASLALEALLERCANLPSERLLFVGDAVDSLAESIRARFGERAVCIASGSPRASDLAWLACDPDRLEWRGHDLEGRSPRYLRGADARRPPPRAHS